MNKQDRYIVDHTETVKDADTGEIMYKVIHRFAVPEATSKKDALAKGLIMSRGVIRKPLFGSYMTTRKLCPKKVK